eukprot:c10128_g5_i2.p1 GENE.c10128_g5_i2~~c10128_g5_i2.p1  ORF type:complete len:116 (+),score=34.93 c10128_g5_i2:149-496(+)
MAAALSKNEKAEGQLQALTQVKVSCAQDNHRSQTLVTQLKDTVTTLHKRQEDIFTDIHTNLRDISTDLGGCGASDSLKPVLSTLFGVVLGVVIVSFLKGNNRSNHHHHRTGAFGV